MNSIKFTYNDYYFQNFLQPIISIIIFSVPLIVIIINALKHHLNCVGENNNLHLIDKCRSIFCLLVILYLIIVQIPILKNGGIYLLYEKENDYVIVTGEIESISQLSRIEGGHYYDYENHTSYAFGESIIVNGSKYYLQYGELKVGDHVTMKVLPKSKLVLELTITDRQDDGS